MESRVQRDELVCAHDLIMWKETERHTSIEIDCIRCTNRVRLPLRYFRWLTPAALNRIISPILGPSWVQYVWRKISA